MNDAEAAHINSQPPWWNQRRTLMDKIRCQMGRHRAAMTGYDDGMMIQRCTCGAIRLNASHWMQG